MRKELSLEISRIGKWAKSNGVLDVVLFGSYARGKDGPSDIDLCVVLRSNDEKKSLDLVDSLGKITDMFAHKYQINVLTDEAFYKGSTLSKVLLSEGFSIIYKKKLADLFGFQSKCIFKYSLTGFSQSRRVQFHYLLRGRYGSAGLLSEIKGVLVSNGFIEISPEHEEKLKEVLDFWKVKYKIKRCLES